MKIKFLLLLYFIALTSLSATTFEDGKSQNTLNWSIYDNTPANASVSNTLDDDKHGEVIEFSGEDLNNGFVIGGFPSDTKAWKHSDEKVLGFDIKTNEKFLIFISLETADGFRFLSYAPISYDNGFTHGLGIDSNNGEWHTFHRDLEADLKDVEPNNSIITINGLFFRGSAHIDNIELIPELPPVTVPNKFRVYDNTPAGATITSITDDVEGEVTRLQGDGTNNGYAIGGRHNSSFAWNETNKTQLLWKMKYNENFLIFVSINTIKGHKYLMYAPIEYNTGYLHGLGSSSKDNTWRNFNRDLKTDLADADPSNELLSVNGFFIRGTGLISIPYLENDTPIEPVCNRGVSDLLRDTVLQEGSSLPVDYSIINPLQNPQSEEYAYYTNSTLYLDLPDNFYGAFIRANCKDHSQVKFIETHEAYGLTPYQYIGTINEFAFYTVLENGLITISILGVNKQGESKILSISGNITVSIEGEHIITDSRIYDENGTLLSRTDLP